MSLCFPVKILLIWNIWGTLEVPKYFDCGLTKFKLIRYQQLESIPPCGIGSFPSINTSMKAFLFASFCALALSATPCLATDNYQYGPNEYVTITDGLSPDGKYAITAHGEGEYGYGNFHLYLTNAETGRNFGPLEEIADTLDTGAPSFCALWSKNSQQVSIFYRISRHEPIQEVSYRIGRGRAFPLSGPANAEPAYEWYWSSHCSYAQRGGKTFGTPLLH